MVKKHKMKNDEEIVDEKTPKSKFKYLRKKFEDKMKKTEDETDIHPKCSGTTFALLSRGLQVDRKESFEKGSKDRTLTPSSVSLEGKTAAFEAKDQFLRKFGPVNNPLECDGQKKRLGEKRKISLMGESSEIWGSNSPRKIPRKENFSKGEINK